MRKTKAVPPPARRAGMLARYWTPLLLAPTLILYVAVFVIPVGAIIQRSFQPSDGGGLTTEWYAALFSRGYYWEVLFRTLWISAVATVVSIVIGFFMAYVAIRIVQRSGVRRLLLFAILAPLFTSAVVRAFGWIFILGREGVINSTLETLHLISEPLSMSSSTFAVVVGLSHVLIPFAYIAIAADLGSHDASLELAAQDLGASALRTFLDVTLPLSKPALIGSFSINLTLAAGSYVVPAVLGGGQVKVLAALIYETFVQQLNWSLGSALAMLLFVPVLLILLIVTRSARGPRLDKGMM